MPRSEECDEEAEKNKEPRKTVEIEKSENWKR
jgi:hypothetical protein